MTVLALWSAPRARSTAFFRSMAERGDVIALHEPFWNVMAFGTTEIHGRLIESPEELPSALLSPASHSQVFFKETTDRRYPRVLGNKEFLRTARHAFLIRRPEDIAASYFALWPEMRMEEVGLENLAEMHNAVIGAGGHAPIVIDSDDLIARPRETMTAYCAATDLPLMHNALRWTPGERPEWERSSEWHVEAAASSGFVAKERTYQDTVANNDMLARFAEHHRPFYEQLRALRLDVEGSERDLHQTDAKE